MSAERTAVALVTGAGRGIGRAIAARLARRGMRLILTSRTKDELERVREELSSEPGPHQVRTADLTSDGEIERLCAAVRDLETQLDVLVLNAGTAIAASIEETTLEQWDRVFRTNVRAPFLLVQGLLPLVRAARGRIIVIGSVVSTAAYPHQGAYTASKHALYGFTKVLAREVHADGVLVHSILPGGVGTEMVRSMRPDIDTRELISPEEVAAAVDTVLGPVEGLPTPGNSIIDEIRLRRRTKEPWQS